MRARSLEHPPQPRRNDLDAHDERDDDQQYRQHDVIVEALVCGEQRSADAASEIRTLIATSSREVAGGVTLVSRTGEAITAMVGRVGTLATLVSEIAQATQDQSLSLDQVSIAVTGMDGMTQRNAAMVEETAAAARSLADEAGDLAAAVARFRTSARSTAPRLHALAA